MAYDIPLEEAFKRAEPLLKTFRLDNKLEWFPANFSKGMKQKVMVLCAFLIEPSLYIIDEPFLGLDPLAIHALLELMDTMRKQGAAILMSTHILATAEKYCDRFVVLHEYLSCLDEGRKGGVTWANFLVNVCHGISKKCPSTCAIF